MTFEELCRKEVISIRDCRKLGYIVDMELDECKGCICKIVVAEKGGMFHLFCGNEELEIPFCNIKQIGSDIILVDYTCS